MSIKVKRFTGADARPYLSELARLRIAIFREFPYLYDGSLDYESGYLDTYVGAPNSVVVVAFDGGRVIGASTGLPMSSETDDIKRPFAAHGYDIERMFYFGESVLERGYRGQGIGVRFFEQREAHATSLRCYDWSAFCAVQRPDNHPRRPRDYQPLDRFWNKRGYEKRPELKTAFCWQDLDESSQSPKPMVFWIKHIASAVQSVKRNSRF
ncbi:MAG: GNAT family N-acetyltransferase [Betaproteobacteria bacterium]|nr:MAG: GNAT family N-acetyltransferase [Betaproteobacteria bacterium]